MGRAGISHLPVGRKPGRQSRRDRIVFPVWVATAAVFFGGLSVWLAVEKVTDGRVDGGDVWALVPFALLAGIYSEVRPRFRRRSKYLRLTASPAEVRRGDSVVATLTIEAGEPLRAERVELGLVCIERYDEQAKRGRWPQTRVETVYEDWREIDVRLARHQLRLEVPPDPPFSYEGRHVSFAWSVSAREVRARSQDRFAHQPIWVSP